MTIASVGPLIMLVIMIIVVMVTGLMMIGDHLNAIDLEFGGDGGYDGGNVTNMVMKMLVLMTDDDDYDDDKVNGNDGDT